MTTVLVFVEHELSEREMGRTLAELADLRVDGERDLDVTVVVPYHADWESPLMLDVAAARGMSASVARGDSRHDTPALASPAPRPRAPVASRRGRAGGLRSVKAAAGMPRSATAPRLIPALARRGRDFVVRRPCSALGLHDPRRAGVRFGGW
jgi:hypothetical protein